MLEIQKDIETEIGTQIYASLSQKQDFINQKQQTLRLKERRPFSFRRVAEHGVGGKTSFATPRTRSGVPIGVCGTRDGETLFSFVTQGALPVPEGFPWHLRPTLLTEREDCYLPCARISSKGILSPQQNIVKNVRLVTGSIRCEESRTLRFLRMPT